MRKLVVAAAIVRGGRVLAARRTAPPEAAGRWELPGGKCEPGEPPRDALEREIAEELGCQVEVIAWLQGSAPIGQTHELRTALARITRGEPTPTEHDQVRWLSAAELGEVDWLEPDRPFLPELQAALSQQSASPRRIIVFDEDDARAVERRLRADGFEAEIARERLSGEDDDEDHPWAVLTDAPSLVAEMLTDEFDGWLDEEGPEEGGREGQVAGGREKEQVPARPGSPIDLPTAPRRIKRTP